MWSAGISLWQEATASILQIYPKDTHSRFFCNVGTYLPYHSAFHLRRPVLVSITAKTFNLTLVTSCITKVCGKHNNGTINFTACQFAVFYFLRNYYFTPQMVEHPKLRVTEFFSWTTEWCSLHQDYSLISSDDRLRDDLRRIFKQGAID
jgi:hypothetical protein